MNLDDYPLDERIGDPRLLVGREKEFAEYHKWIAGIPRRISKSRVIVARKKCGKTAFVQRLFNQLWRQNGPVIPIYIEIEEIKTWYPDLAMDYFRTFATQYISFLDRDPELLKETLDLDEIREYGNKHNPSLLRIAEKLKKNFEMGLHDSMWRDAVRTPHVMAGVHKTPFLVIIDEFQNLSNFVYRDQRCETAPDETIPGMYHEVSESKIAPMLATGSVVSRLIEVVERYLEGGRLTEMHLSPYLTTEEGLSAVYRYAEIYEEPITNESALLINRLCHSDPHFVACVIRSKCPDRDLTTREGVIRALDYETTADDAEMLVGWRSWFERSIGLINQRNAKRILLFLTRNPGKVYTAEMVRSALNLEIDVTEVEKRLIKLRRASMLRSRFSNEFIGLEDGTFFLLLQRWLRNELAELDPEADQGIDYLVNKLTGEKRALQNQLNQVSGRLAEAQLEIDMRVRGTFRPSVYFKDLPEDPELETGELFPRFMVQGPDGKKGEIDLRVDAESGSLTLLVEVKKTKDPSGESVIRKLASRAELFAKRHPERKVLSAVLSLGGFTEEARDLCQKLKIGTATSINYIHKQWD